MNVWRACQALEDAGADKQREAMDTEMDKLVMQFLGTGAGEGVPTPFCRCAVCENARRKKGKEIRLRSCFRLSEQLLIDFGPDILASCAHLGTDLYEVKHILVTHTHSDHFDISNLFLKPMITRSNGEKLHLYFTGDSARILSAADKMGYDGKEGFFAEHLSRHAVVHTLTFWERTQAGAYGVTPVKGSHRAHFEQNSANYLLELPDGRKLLYALDTGFYSQETLDFLKGHRLNLLIIEATFGSADRGDTPYSHLDARSVNYMLNVLYEQGTLRDGTRVYLSHINQEQNYTHEQMEDLYSRSRTPYPIRVAYDGMVLEEALDLE
ncbi:MBL fold metallo-hydrolase [Cohnella hongkongensis]|uniref:MBL fold metallo-hydrolase n=1 Tax=Cohnella hongkongensis TaxID=178337 RepID=A0ABV9FEW9_9BACL